MLSVEKERQNKMYETELRAIAAYHGLNTQLVQLAGKNTQLARAALEYRNSAIMLNDDDNFDTKRYVNAGKNLINEIADTQILISQIVLLLNMNDAVADAMEQKIGSEYFQLFSEKIGQVDSTPENEDKDKPNKTSWFKKRRK